MISARDSSVDWEVDAADAKAAAEQGRWESVREYYERREAWLHGVKLTPQAAGRLAEHDGVIKAMILAAQAVLTHSLSEAATVRRTIMQLRRSFGVGGSSAVRLSRRL